MEELMQKIAEKFKEGYSITDTVRLLTKDVQDNFHLSEYHLHLLVTNFFKKTEKELSAEAKQNLKAKRVIVKEQIKVQARKKVADQVLTRMNYSSDRQISRDTYNNAVRATARMNGLSESSIIGYLKEFYPEIVSQFHVDYSPEFCIEFGKKMLEGAIPQGDAKKIPGYMVAIDYIEKNEPEMYAQLKEMWAINKINRITFSENASKIKRLKDPTLLVKILLEFRISPTDACMFVNRFKNIFLQDSVSVLTKEELMEDLNAIKDENRDAIKWYLYEAVSPDQYSEYRLEKFNNFIVQFETLINDERRLKEFVNFVCHNHLEKLSGRTPKHFSENKSNYTLEEAYILAKYSYKMGLSESMRGNLIQTESVRNDLLVPKLKQSPNIEAQMVADGLKKLGEYNLSIVDFDHSERRKQGKL